MESVRMQEAAALKRELWAIIVCVYLVCSALILAACSTTTVKVREGVSALPEATASPSPASPSLRFY